MMRVQNWPILVIFLISILMVSGCSTFKFPDITVTEIERTPLVLPEVDELDLDSLEWYIVTQENAADVIDVIEKRGNDPVLFGLTDNGYERASLNSAKTLKLIRQYRAVIQALKEYYIENTDGVENGDSE